MYIYRYVYCWKGIHSYMSLKYIFFEEMQSPLYDNMTFHIYSILQTGSVRTKIVLVDTWFIKRKYVQETHCSKYFQKYIHFHIKHTPKRLKQWNLFSDKQKTYFWSNLEQCGIRKCPLWSSAPFLLPNMFFFRAALITPLRFSCQIRKWCLHF